MLNEAGPSYQENKTKEKGFTFEEILQGKDNVIAAKDALITQLYKNIKLLEDKVEYLSEKLPISDNENVKKKTFCEALEANINVETSVTTIREGAEPKLRNDSDNFIFIKPTCKQDNRKTKKDVVKYVNTKDLQLGIQKVFDLKNGGIKIQCESKEDVDRLKKEALEKMGDDYEMKTQDKKNPKIKIIGLEENYNKEELKNSIKSQNNTITENSKIEVIVIKQMKTRFMAIMEVDPETFKAVMKSGHLLVDLSVCSVFEHVDVLRCFKCTGYHHTNKNCTNKSSFCIKCGLTGHFSQNCNTDPKDFCCPNCCEANEKFKLSFPINHGPFNRECSILKRKTEIEKRKVRYQ